MNGGVLEIGPWQLALALVFIIVSQLASFVYKLGLIKDLSIGTVRTFAQLFLMGYVLKFIFKVELSWVTLLVFLFMTAAAAHTIRGRVGEKEIPFITPMFVSMLVSYFVVSLIVTGVIVSAKPWWQPRYFIPLAGMVVGNSMNSLAIALDRMFSDFRSKKDAVEMKLTLGADFKEASQDIIHDAIKAGMIPAINSMMGVGLVFIPGMMTGQILAGADPVLAIRYQIVVMLMLVASTGLSTLIVILLVRKKCFGKGQQLIISSQ